jgi:tetratricopeptide (TPR) repeat protein
MRRDLQSLVRSVERAVWAGESTEYLLPDLRRIEAHASIGSDAWCFAVREIASRTATEEPWAASLAARRLLAERPADAGAWAALGLAQSLVGNHRFAVKAYRRSLALVPQQARVLHNLGHLVDVVLDDPATALGPLSEAFAADPECIDTALSYAHALARVERADEGLALVEALVLDGRRLRRGLRKDQRAALEWLRREAKCAKNR